MLTSALVLALSFIGQLPGQGKGDATDINRLGVHRRSCLDATNLSIHPCPFFPPLSPSRVIDVRPSANGWSAHALVPGVESLDASAIK
jgi:hypothetical protein